MLSLTPISLPSGHLHLPLPLPLPQNGLLHSRKSVPCTCPSPCTCHLSPVSIAPVPLHLRLPRTWCASWTCPSCSCPSSSPYAPLLCLPPSMPSLSCPCPYVFLVLRVPRTWNLGMPRGPSSHPLIRVPRMLPLICLPRMYPSYRALVPLCPSGPSTRFLRVSLPSSPWCPSCVTAPRTSPRTCTSCPSPCGRAPDLSLLLVSLVVRALVRAPRSSHA